MELKKFLLEQLEREAVASRKAVERVPEGQGSWKPHQKSMELSHLASLVAAMPGWPAVMIDHDEVDLDGDGQSFRTSRVETRAELLAALEASLATSRKALENTTEGHLLKHWRLKMGGQVLTEGPRYVAIADAALSHMAHRGRRALMQIGG